ncbi:uncharacterized protein LOC127445546 [Myxocyprinus asiaticus]|uniref:uncharacterized protein LOC127445546 n=1 Tax=Myxocyprinus asiaticus TaxID=70543 RepID=UPI00222293EA|nr:uncharacterized protein LOC127445546 [Myxocyprinus asiaticus]
MTSVIFDCLGRGRLKIATALAVTAGGLYCLYRCGLLTKSSLLDRRIQRVEADHHWTEGCITVLEGSPVTSEDLSDALELHPTLDFGVLALVPLSQMGRLKPAWGTTRFQFTDSEESEFERLEMKYCFVHMVRGVETRLLWALSTEKTMLDPNGRPYYRMIKQACFGAGLVCGQIMQYVTHLRLETTVEVHYGFHSHTHLSVAHFIMSFGMDGQITTSSWAEEESFDCPSESDSGPESEYSDYSEGSDDEDLTPVERELPNTSLHLHSLYVFDVPMKLEALRLAFSTLLSRGNVQNTLYVAGKNLLSHLVAANKQDVNTFKEAYDRVIRLLRRSDQRDAVKKELHDVGVHQLNFLDVFFEFILVGLVQNNLPEAVCNGGFLEHLNSLISTWDIPGDWEPAADQQFWQLHRYLMDLLEALANLPLDTYHSPDLLVNKVSALIAECIQLMRGLDTI